MIPPFLDLCRVVFRSIKIVTASLLAIYSATLPAGASGDGAPRLVPDSVELPATTLRGYGTVSGKYQKRGDGSCLVIQCENESKAKLLQAKYLSDLTVLPGARLVNDHEGLVEAEGQGFLGAWQNGTAVTILAAPTKASFDRLLGELRPRGISRAQVEVPMFLDRWDKWGWRFYYRFWSAPKGAAVNSYDQLVDFDKAAALGQTGFTFWDRISQLNTTEGMRMPFENLWLGEAADRRRLPIGLHLSAETYSFPTWLTNRYPEQVQQKMPQFSGNVHKIADPQLGGRGFPSWTSDDMYNAAYATIQDSIRRFQAFPSLTSILEPHGELYHGDQEILFEYGPLADASYREYLKARYATPEAVAKRWFGAGGSLDSWNAVHVPEIASFLGWDQDKSVDLVGDWAVGYEELKDPNLKLSPPKNAELNNQTIPTVPAPDDWYAADFDDSSWPKLQAPGNDQIMLMQHRPAVFRRSFQMPPEKLRQYPRWWLYVWDLNDAKDDKVAAWLNGKKAGESLVKRAVLHWSAFEVTPWLAAGKNQLSLRLPKGFLGYRVYLSPEEPRYYPQLGEGKNAQWVDFLGWRDWMGQKQVERGMEVIREVDPERQITLMAPDHYADSVKTLAKKFGGEFHNTGYMGVFYADYLPGLMQGAGLPFSIEPGEPAKDLPEFKKMMGLYLTENVQGVDYFIHAGSILWNPEILKNYETNLNLYHLMGKYHVPKGDVAVLFSQQSRNLTGFPWVNDVNAVQPSGYFAWNIAAPLRGLFDYDLLSESSFALGDAAKYRVILDSNTAIMDEKLLKEIEAWVRAGGIFITSGQTGRHTPEKFNAWPISQLSGFKTERVDRYSPDGRAEETHTLSVAPEQKVFPEAWNQVRANGVAVQKVANDAQSLLLWDDGLTAVGMRRLGQGMVIQAGVNFGNAKAPDRLEGATIPDQLKKFRTLYSQILEAVNIPRVPGGVEPAGVYSRHYISNNGLFDVWIAWNQNPQTVTARLNFSADKEVKSGREVTSGSAVAVTHGENNTGIDNITLDPMQSRGYLIPRNRISEAPLEWFNLQRNWWNGAAIPSHKPLPSVASLQKWAVDLSDQWAFKPLVDSENAETLAQPGYTDTSWERRMFMIWSAKYPEVKHAMFRRTFRVPENWQHGPVMLSLQYWERIAPINGSANVWLDGKLITSGSNGLSGRAFDELTAGSQHTLAVEIKGNTPLVGPIGGVWISHRPNAETSQDLGGEWSMSGDALRYDASVKLPGLWNGWLAKREVLIDKQYEHKNVFLHYAGSANLTGLIINGRWIRQDHHQSDKEWMINITPWVHFGEPNLIQVGRMDSPGEGVVNTLSLEFYDPTFYP